MNVVRRQQLSDLLSERVKDLSDVGDEAGAARTGRVLSDVQGELHELEQGKSETRSA